MMIIIREMMTTTMLLSDDDDNDADDDSADDSGYDDGGKDNRMAMTRMMDVTMLMMMLMVQTSMMMTRLDRIEQLLFLADVNQIDNMLQRMLQRSGSIGQPESETSPEKCAAGEILEIDGGRRRLNFEDGAATTSTPAKEFASTGVQACTELSRLRMTASTLLSFRRSNYLIPTSSL